MKILLVTNGIYPYVIGGMEKHSYYLAKYLAKNNVEIDLFHVVKEGNIPEHNGADPKFFTPEEIENINFLCSKFPKTDRLPGHYLRETHKYSEEVYNSVKDKIEDYDLIYTKGFTGRKFIEMRKKSKLHVPVLVKFHGYEMFQKPPSLAVKMQHMLLKSATKWDTVNADYVCSYGGKITEIVRQLGVPAQQIIEIPTGIQETWLTSEKETGFQIAKNEVRKFVFVGRYERRKGIEELSSVLRKIIAEGKSGFEFHFIGSIPPDKQIQDDKIVYHGIIRDPNKMQQLLRGCDIMLCPSHSEGMPNVIMEGMASGLAIIATNVGAVAAQIQGNGWLLKEPDTQLIEKALLEACEIDQNQLRALKNRSLQLIKEHFLWDQVIKQTISEFEKVRAQSRSIV